MAEKTGRRLADLTRRDFVKLSFGILALSIQPYAGSLEGRLEEAGIGTYSLQDRPSLKRGIMLSMRSSSAGTGATLTSHTLPAEFVLNDSAAFALSRCDGSSTLSEIGQALADRYGVPVDRAHGDLVDFFDCLNGLGLLSPTVVARLDRQSESAQSMDSAWEISAT